MTVDDRRERLRNPPPRAAGPFLLVGIAVVALGGQFVFELIVGSDEAVQT